MTQPRYEAIADALSARINSGEFPPDSKLPGIGKLAKTYGVSTRVVHEAVCLLELERKVVVRDKRGTFVLPREDTRYLVNLGNDVDRNGLGYVFTRSAGHWPPVGNPSRDWVPCPAEVAEYLDLPEGTEVLARHRVVGPRNIPIQITTTYIHPDLARGTLLEAEDTGPGGWIDRAEQNFGPDDLGLGPFEWFDDATARLPTEAEVATLGISPRRPVWEIYRPHIDPTDRTVAVDVVVLEARRFRLRVPIHRSEAAQWPTTPATARNSPPSVGDTPEEVPDDQRHPGQGG